MPSFLTHEIVKCTALADKDADIRDSADVEISELKTQLMALEDDVSCWHFLWG